MMPLAPKPQFLQKNNQVPASAGFFMPAEWAPHEATWLSWPHNAETWPGRRLEDVRKIYLQMLEALLDHEKVHLLTGVGQKGEEALRFIRKSGINTKNLTSRCVDTVDAWIRDYGPTFLLSQQGSRAWCKWIFNAWGEKYPELMQDARIFAGPQDLISDRCFDAGMVLEGGSIEVNGDGTCLTTEQCLLNKNRNPKFSRDEIEQRLKDYLGVSQMVWLGEGIVGDDTDGHIDDLARFVSRDTIALAFEDDERDENHRILKDNWQRLKDSSDARGKKWNLVKLPMPGKVADEGVRLPASYANFYIANEVVLLPTYQHPNDKRAARILQELFPRRTVVAIFCRALVYGLGAIHCVSQQEPAI